VKRKWIWCALALLVLAGTVWLLWPRDPVSRATYQKIQIGMTLEEVEALIGRPSISIDTMIDILFKQRRVKWVAPDPDGILHDGNDWSKARPDMTKIRCWESTQAGIAVQLGDDGRVIGKHFEERASAGLVDRVRTVFGW